MNINIYWILSTILIAIHMVSYLIFTTILSIRYFYHLHFTDGIIEALRSETHFSQITEVIIGRARF